MNDEFIIKLQAEMGLDNLDGFDWKADSWILASRFSQYFFSWWDTEKFNWGEHGCYLAISCSEYLEYWWNPDKFNWRTHADLLKKFCNDSQDIWGSDYIEIVLSQEKQ